MTKLYYDTEFLETGSTIELISIGMVTEDGREYYAVNADMPVYEINTHNWLMDNVWLHLPLTYDGELNREHPSVKRRHVIAEEVKAFILATPDVELWAWYGAFDHVALAWLYGPMSQLPDGIPMWTNDLRQERLRLGDPVMPDQKSGEHNALSDARHNLAMGEFLAMVAARRETSRG